MASVSFLNVDKTYPGGTRALVGLSLDIADKEFMVIMGPSGCGKSTLLKLISGLEKPTAGRIFIDGVDVTDLPPSKRGAAVVTQSNSLFPHMTVFNNLAFGLTVLKTDKKTIRQKVLDAAEALDISDLLDRKPYSLSGGQKQRVALGRALVVSPRVFLLDEPLSNLDSTLKALMRAEIKRLHKAVGTTFIYVTHDVTEAMSLGERIAVLKGGVLNQVGTPRQIYDNPANKFTAQFIGSPGMSFLDVKIIKESNNLYACFFGEKMQLNPENTLPELNLTENSTGYEAVMGIRPEDISLADEKALNGGLTEKARDIDNYFFTSARVSLIESAGGENIIHAALNKDGLNKTALNKTVLEKAGSVILKCPAGQNISLDSDIQIAINKTKLKFFDKTSGMRIF